MLFFNLIIELIFERVGAKNILCSTKKEVT